MSRQGFNDRETINTKKISRPKDVLFMQNSVKEKKIKRTYLLDEVLVEAIRIISFENKMLTNNLIKDILLKAIPNEILEKARENIKE